VAQPVRVRYARISRLVDGLLTKYHVRRAPVDVQVVAEGEGFRISRERLEEELSGFLVKGSRGFVIGVNSKNAPTRQRFTIAHECGHALLHDFDDVHVDKAFKLRSPLSSEATDIEEIEANTFAASLLMPEGMLREDLLAMDVDVESDEDVAKLSRKYDVSQQAMSYRVANLLSRTGAARRPRSGRQGRLF
jgi:Zn-dependent peptidase ImmA (M78 family)